ncbi:MAG: PEP-CTERM sorting domain-containing protein [Phycisphaerae bacterium]
MAARILCCGSVLLLAASQSFATPVGVGIDFNGTTFGAELCYNGLGCPAAESPGAEALVFPNDQFNVNTISENGAGAVQRWAVLASQVQDPGDATQADVTVEFVRLAAQQILADQPLVIRILNLDSQPLASPPDLVLSGPVTGEFVINGAPVSWVFPDPVALAPALPGQFDLELDFGTNGPAGMFGGVIQAGDKIDIARITLPIMKVVIPEPGTIVLLAGFGGLWASRRRRTAR